VAFSGSVREAALRFPDGVNVAVAAALAGPGLDRTRIDVMQPGPVPRHRLALTVRSRFGTTGAWSEPRVAPGVHPVAACLIAALRRELQTVWAG
jgi:aspartate dehydrogenase